MLLIIDRNNKELRIHVFNDNLNNHKTDNAMHRSTDRTNGLMRH